MNLLLEDQKAVLSAIPNLFELSYDAAMNSFDYATSNRQLKIKSLSYSPSIHWSIGRHIKGK